MAEKNYYDTLGVDSTASEADIKKAYRKLVRKYHPDVSKEVDADARMAEINQAYEVLKESDKRKAYDSYLKSPLAGKHPFDAGTDYDNFANQYYRQAGGGFGGGSAEGFDADAFERASGFRFDDLFGGFGGQAASGASGFGSRRARSPKGDDQHAELTIDIAAAYTGDERSLTLNVPVVKDGQMQMQSKTLKVKIPKGIAEGQQIRLAGQGMPSPYPQEKDAKAGDLYLKVAFSESDALYVKGKDVHQKIAIAPWEAALGGQIEVNTPAGRLGVKVPDNTQNGKTLRLKGKGIPAKEAGDLYLTLDVTMPTTTSDADKQAWRDVAAHFTNFNPAR